MTFHGHIFIRSNPASRQIGEIIFIDKFVIIIEFSTEEMWQAIGCEGRVYQQTWPEYDEAKTVESSVEIAVQINGKVKGTLGIQKDDPKDEVIAKAKEVMADKLTGNIVKEIYVPGRLVNIVMK